MARIELHAKINTNALQSRIQDAVIDSRTGTAVHNLLAKMCDPYVPFLEGPLSQTVEVYHDKIRYTQPYARYQYYGEVYGPNIPIVQDGMIVGWFSPPGQKKHPTGRAINYSKDKHPLSSSFWDKAMLKDKGDEFNEQVKAILVHMINSNTTE